jgi:hypothetical protein
MKRDVVAKYEFVRFMPKEFADGTIYISIEFATAAHKCFCGCGNKVVTPLSPAGWEITFDGVSVTFDPSIGNWSFPCQSHYWIRRNRVEWAPRWSKEEITANRRRDRSDQEQYVSQGEAGKEKVSSVKTPESVWRRIRQWLHK